ncbi:MAG: hypothetical protein NTW16_00995 [Bacteroidetes bacterium]|nr:hypothetical protein [Bacteroidota bacterium]
MKLNNEMGSACIGGNFRQWLYEDAGRDIKQWLVNGMLVED